MSFIKIDKHHNCLFTCALKDSNVQVTISAVRWGYLFCNFTYVIYDDYRRKKRSADFQNATRKQQNFTEFSTSSLPVPINMTTIASSLVTNLLATTTLLSTDTQTTEITSSTLTEDIQTSANVETSAPENPSAGFIPWPIDSSVTGPIVYIEVPQQVPFVANLTISYGFDLGDWVSFKKINKNNNSSK